MGETFFKVTGHDAKGKEVLNPPLPLTNPSEDSSLPLVKYLCLISSVSGFSCQTLILVMLLPA